MGLCSASSKCILLILNLLFWISAAFLVFAGVKYIEASGGVLDDVHSKPALITFGLAGLLFFLGLIGIIGAFAEKKVLLGIFSFFAVATLVLFVVVSVGLFTQEKHATNETNTFILKQFNRYGPAPKLAYLDTDSLNRVVRDTGLVKDEYTNSSATETTTPGTDTTTHETGTTTSTTPKKRPPRPKTTPAPTTTEAETTTAKTTEVATNGTMTTTDSVTTAAPPVDGVNATEFIDTVQTKLECCGYDNYTDWANFEKWGPRILVPHSCCNETAAAQKNTTCDGKALNVKSDEYRIFNQGCKKEVDKVVHNVYKLLSYISVGFCVFVLLCLLATLYLMCRKKDDGFNYSSIVA